MATDTSRERDLELCPLFAGHSSAPPWRLQLYAVALAALLLVVVKTNEEPRTAIDEAVILGEVAASFGLLMIAMPDSLRHRAAVWVLAGAATAAVAFGGGRWDVIPTITGPRAGSALVAIGGALFCAGLPTLLRRFGWSGEPGAKAEAEPLAAA